MYGDVHIMYSVSAHIGCYKENLRKRVYSLNPGNVKPGTVTQEVCMKACGIKYNYAAISKGWFVSFVTLTRLSCMWSLFIRLTSENLFDRLWEL